MASLSLKKIYKKYDNGFCAVTDFNLEVADKEFVVFVGPSGCGKSTTLRMIAGLEDITEGEFYIGDKLVNDVEPKDRDIAMVFQSYALYPHMTVFDNMAFALKLRKVPKDEIKAKVEEAAKILGLEELLDRKPKALSGGQRQRVALGRAIVRSPKVFLMDEPLSNLDAKLREEMRFEIKEIQKRLGITVVYVTHDQIEAMTMSDRIILINKGVVQQIGTPEEIYRNPVNPFVANFVGRVNFIKGVAKDGFVELANTGKKLPYDGDKIGNVIVAIRPEALRIDERDGTIDAKLVSQFYLGDVNDCKVDLGNDNVVRVIDHVETYGVYEENANIKLRIKNFMVFDDDGKDYTKIIT